MLNRLSISLIIAIIGLALLTLADTYYRGEVQQVNAQLLQKTMEDAHSKLAEGIAARISLADDLRAFMLAPASLPDDKTFDRFAALLLERYPHALAAQYVDPNRIIRHVYPLKGNEAALNLDLMTRPAAPFVEKAIQERRLTVNNPTVTVVGSLSVIPRVPLYRGDKLLGLVQVVIEIEPFLTDVTRNLDSRFQFQLWDATGTLFWGPEVLNGEITSTTVPVGDNFWTLKMGWQTAPPAPDNFVLSLIWGSGGILLLSVLFIVNQTWNRTEWLKQSVAERTSELEREVAHRQRTEQKLRASNLRLEQILSASPLPILGTDANGWITSWNSAAERLFGWSEAEAVGKMCPTVPPEQTADYLEMIQLAMQGETLNGLVGIRQKQDGSRLVCSISAAPQINERGETAGVTLILDDITERKKAESRIQLQMNRLRALNEIDRAISSSLDMRLSLDILLKEVLTQLGVDAAAVLLLNSSSLKLEYFIGKGFLTDSIQQSKINLGEGLAGRVGLEQETLLVRNLGKWSAQFKRAELLKEENFVEYFGVPLLAKGSLKGVLEIFNRSQLDIDPDWLDYLETLAGQAALAIDNAQLFASVQQSNMELIIAYDATIEGWSRALDLRDKETEGHSQRVTELTLELAKKMGIPTKEQVHLRRGAHLHDIGKLGVPDHILLKEDKLTDEEWEIMRKHPTYAFQMLSRIHYLRPALDIPYCHHEKWDGTGYPRGLQGEQIPLVARIFAVVDVWDALTSDRPYRKAWPKEKALEYIKEQAGYHFDPNVVDIFLKTLASSGTVDLDEAGGAAT